MINLLSFLFPMSPVLLFGWHLRLDVLVWPWRISEINFPDLSSTFQACGVRPAGHCVVSIVLMISDSGLNVLETSSGLGFFDVFHGEDPDGLDFFYFSRHVRRELGGVSYECRFLKLEDFIGSFFHFVVMSFKHTS